MDFVFSDLKLPAPDRALLLDEMKRIPARFWKSDSNLGGQKATLFSYKGSGLCSYEESKAKIFCQPGDLRWTEGMEIGATQKYLEETFFSWMSHLGRVHVLRTPPGQCMPIHYDCRRGNHLSPQPKMRVILSGTSKDLFFLDTNSTGHRMHCFDAPGGFVIDGSWPHGIVNSSTEDRYTLAIGSPWSGQDNLSEYLGEKKIFKSQLSFPEYSEIFLDKYMSMTYRELDLYLRVPPFFKAMLFSQVARAKFRQFRGQVFR